MNCDIYCPVLYVFPSPFFPFCMMIKNPNCFENLLDEYQRVLRSLAYSQAKVFLAPSWRPACKRRPAAADAQEANLPFALSLFLSASSQCKVQNGGG